MIESNFGNSNKVAVHLFERLVEFEFNEFNEFNVVILIVSVFREFADFKIGLFRILIEFVSRERSRRGEE
jgi:hypothetical protein